MACENIVSLPTGQNFAEVELELRLYSVHSDLRKASVGILLRLVLTGLAFAMIWLDVAVFHTEILEVSFTEVLQEVLLFACALLFWLAPGEQHYRGFRVLVGGFFACLLMRELDGLFDPVSHSAWCLPFSLIAVVCLIVAFSSKHRGDTFIALAAFSRTPAFGSMATGLGVLVFSRIFGMGSLWHLILDEGYARLAKTTVEEGIELLTYSMWFAASLEFYWATRTVRADAAADHTLEAQRA